MTNSLTARSKHFTRNAIRKDRTATQKNLSTPPKNARKVYVVHLDPNINVDHVHELFEINTTAYL